MNSSAAGKTYIKMQNQLLKDDDCACFLVEAIAKQSQNVKWATTVDGKTVSHKRIRRVSIDQFYALVTGQEDAFYQICMVLPDVIKKVITDDGENIKIPHDTVLSELREVAAKIGESDENLAMAMAVYLLGFNTYAGFDKKMIKVFDNDKSLKIIYEYVKRIKGKQKDIEDE